MIVSAIAEGLHAYVLLSDNRILKSRQLDNTHCAKVYAEMLSELDLTPEQMLTWAKWSETDE